MTTIKPKPITQHCIKSHFFAEVMMNLPKAVKITSIQFEVGFAIKRLSRPITASMANCGVSAVRKSEPSVEIDGHLVGTRDAMKKNVKTICDNFGLKTNTVRVKRMTIEVGKMLGVFHRMQKTVPAGDDKVGRRTVLGLVKWEGDEDKIAKACHTNPFKCSYTVQTVRTVLCEEG